MPQSFESKMIWTTPHLEISHTSKFPLAPSLAKKKNMDIDVLSSTPFPRLFYMDIDVLSQKKKKKYLLQLDTR